LQPDPDFRGISRSCQELTPDPYFPKEAGS
jgi:hypothetical protein